MRSHSRIASSSVFTGIGSGVRAWLGVGPCVQPTLSTVRAAVPIRQAMHMAYGICRIWGSSTPVVDSPGSTPSFAVKPSRLSAAGTRKTAGGWWPSNMRTRA
ncbi:hypothetical protein D779_1440 [Imhoffiella purpurea]|uniref:Uncharacterized protein n=1 Tax=Imhoffiella purpurea TaxID=1249627 RepID=W9V7G6_9GAMM|nr:hypothetical protein D779_1440 [Imhoffiella purpurea]